MKSYHIGTMGKKKVKSFQSLSDKFSINAYSDSSLLNSSYFQIQENTILILGPEKTKRIFSLSENFLEKLFKSEEKNKRILIS